MNRNVKIVVVAVIMVAAIALGVINNEKSMPQNFQGSLSSPLGLMNLHPSASTLIDNCLVSPQNVALNTDTSTTISFELQQKANVEVALMKDGKNAQTLPTQGLLNQGVNKLIWTNQVMKELVSARKGEYTIRISAKDDQNPSAQFCEVPFTVSQ